MEHSSTTDEQITDKLTSTGKQRDLEAGSFRYVQGSFYGSCSFLVFPSWCCFNTLCPLVDTLRVLRPDECHWMGVESVHSSFNFSQWSKSSMVWSQVSVASTSIKMKTRRKSNINSVQLPTIKQRSRVPAKNARYGQVSWHGLGPDYEQNEPSDDQGALDLDESWECISRCQQQLNKSRKFRRVTRRELRHL